MLRPGDWLIKRYVPDHDHPERAEVRTRLAYLTAWVSIIGNIILAAVKFVLGLVLNSISMMADAAHTAGDVFTSIVVVVGFRASARPADRTHPFGHGRAETVAGLVIAIFLVVVAFEFMTSSVKRLIHPEPVQPAWWAIALMLVFAALKEVMARFAYRVGKHITSEAVEADAWHHRSDAIASILVVLALVAAYWNIERLDAVFGLLVALLIGYVAFELAMSAASTLVGKAPSVAFKDDVRRTAMTVTGVLGVHGISVHEYGVNKAIAVHVETPANMPVEEAHEVASRVEDRIAGDFSASVVVHVEPAPGGEEPSLRERVEEAIGTAARENPGVVGFHAVNIHEMRGTGHIDLHIETDGSQTLWAAHELGHRVKARIEQLLPGFAVNMHVEPPETRPGKAQGV